MSISIMTLSAEAKDKRFRSKDYHELTQLTKEGIFVNIVDKDNCDAVADRFFSSTDVYANGIQYVREFFGSI